jgi:hypothetical protein
VLTTFRGKGGRRGRGGHIPQAFFRPSPGQKFVVTHSPFDLFKVTHIKTTFYLLYIHCSLPINEVANKM